MWPFKPSWLKKARELEKAGRRFLNYKRDRLRPETLHRIEACLGALREARQRRDQEACRVEGENLEALCEAAAPRRDAVLRENVEVFFVALVIALAIKSYLLQPFMIPTGSMQPTLNGVKGTPMSVLEHEPDWNALEKLGQRLLAGRGLVDLEMEQEKTLVGIHESTFLRFFVVSQLSFADGSTRRVWMPMQTLLGDFGFGQRLAGLAVEQGAVRRNEAVIQRGQLTSPVRLPAGTELARGVLSLGDQVFVDRVSYHFRPPRRGEVFVFTTKDIDTLMEDAKAKGLDGQHYIKRLVGLPGDRVEIREAEYGLYVDGEPAREAGSVAVASRGMTAEGAYSGYRVAKENNSNQPYQPWWPEETDAGPVQEMRLRKSEYLALGDNSASSLDSRYWGPVPEENVVGPAWLSYWPFHSHWGTIE